MNLLLFTGADRLDETRIAVHDRRLQHLLQVHRAQPGDTLRVGEINGLMGEAEILQIDDKAAVLAVALDQPPPPKLPLRLILALPRPKMLRRIVRNVAELGVAELHLINSYRVEKSYWQTPALEAATVREYLLQGLEQSRDTRLPAVQYHRRFKPFVEDNLPGLLAGRTALLAHPGEHPPCPRNIEGECLLVIGPEGGFIPYEVEKLRDGGCQPVSLGARILRVENAVTSSLSRLF
ncbi:Ribosomal RNA small subunit methyltransferase E [Halioglobus japonicus]|nr:Ribosomal RNA small subunit methyltransferase E [Halioglobus japonicus]